MVRGSSSAGSRARKFVTLSCLPQLIVNLSDNISFERIINEPKRGIDQNRWRKSVTLLICARYVHVRCLLTSCLFGIKGKSKTLNIWDFANMIDWWEQLNQLTITELVEAVLKNWHISRFLMPKQPWKARLGLKISREFFVTKNFDDNPDGQEEETGLDNQSFLLNDLALISGHRFWQMGRHLK